MEKKIYRQIIALLLLTSLFLASCTSGTVDQSTVDHSLDGNRPTDTARLLCPPSPGNNPYVSWNS